MIQRQRNSNAWGTAAKTSVGLLVSRISDHAYRNILANREKFSASRHQQKETVNSPMNRLSKSVSRRNLQRDHAPLVMWKN
jgi:hypothetical protein